MNTKTDGISSGLVASIYLAFSDDGENIRFWTSNAFHAVEWAQENWETEAFVRLSDAEAIIAQKDAEILEQCRINGMGAEREATLLGKVERQSTALKLAREALMHDGYPCGNGCKCRACEALAAIDALGEVK